MSIFANSWNQLNDWSSKVLTFNIIFLQQKIFESFEKKPFMSIWKHIFCQFQFLKLDFQKRCPIFDGQSLKTEQIHLLYYWFSCKELSNFGCWNLKFSYSSITHPSPNTLFSYLLPALYCKLNLSKEVVLIVN